MNYVAYCRVSTARQGASGLGLDAQAAAIDAYTRQTGGTILARYVEVESGRKCDRPQLAQALALARTRGATLVVAKLDRLARNVAFTAALLESGVEFMACDFPHANRLMLHILAAVAEYEAGMISLRVKAALAEAKKRGRLLGAADPRCRGKLTRQQLLERSQRAKVARHRKAAAFRAAVRPIAQALRTDGQTLAATAAALNAQGWRTAKGQPWTYATVDLLLRVAPWESSQS